MLDEPVAGLGEGGECAHVIHAVREHPAMECSEHRQCDWILRAMEPNAQTLREWTACGRVVCVRPVGAVQVQTPSGVIDSRHPAWCLKPW